MLSRSIQATPVVPYPTLLTIVNGPFDPCSASIDDVAHLAVPLPGDVSPFRFDTNYL